MEIEFLDEPEPAEPVEERSFRNARWKTRWLVAGLALWILWPVAFLLSRTSPVLQEQLQIPWINLSLTVVHHLSLVVFPFVFVIATTRPSLKVPPLVEGFIEVAIAIPIVWGVIISMGILGAIAQAFFPDAIKPPDFSGNLARSPAQIYVWCILGLAVFMAPLSEEIFFRAFLYNAFRARMPRIGAILASSLLFGLAHYSNLYHVLYAFIIGIGLTVIYEWRKTLLAPMLVHAGVNFLFAVVTVANMFLVADEAVLGVYPEPAQEKCVITKVVPNSAADEAGVKAGDTLVKIDDKPIGDFNSLREVLKEHQGGDKVDLTIKRQGKELVLPVTLKRRADL